MALKPRGPQASICPFLIVHSFPWTSLYVWIKFCFPNEPGIADNVGLQVGSGKTSLLCALLGEMVALDNSKLSTAGKQRQVHRH